MVFVIWHGMKVSMVVSNGMDNVSYLRLLACWLSSMHSRVCMLFPEGSEDAGIAGSECEPHYTPELLAPTPDAMFRHFHAKTLRVIRECPELLIVDVPILLESSS